MRRRIIDSLIVAAGAASGALVGYQYGAVVGGPESVHTVIGALGAGAGGGLGAALGALALRSGNDDGMGGGAW